MKRKDFALLIAGKFISLLGSNMQQFALSLYVLAVTKSVTVFASMLSVSIIPRLLLSPVAGVFGDWFERKRMAVSLDLASALLISGYAALFFINGSLSVAAIYVLVILLEVIEVFFHSSMAAVLPSIVSKEDLMEANTFNSLVMNIGQLLAPVIAALVYGTFGLSVVFIVNAVSFFVSAISKAMINIPKNTKMPAKVSLQAFKTDLMQGIDLIRKSKLISTIISLGTVINFCIAPLFSVGLIFIIKEVLKATDVQLGLFETVFSASMIVTPLLCAPFLKKIKVGKLCFLSFIAVALLVMLMVPVPSGPVLGLFQTNLMPILFLLIITFLIGVAATIANIAVGTLFDLTVPLELMGRTSTVFNLAVTVFIPIGQMISGFLYDSVSPSFVIAGSAVILAAALFIFRKQLIEADSAESKTEAVNEA
jgi:MFS family permease